MMMMTTMTQTQTRAMSSGSASTIGTGRVLAGGRLLLVSFGVVFTALGSFLVSYFGGPQEDDRAIFQFLNPHIPAEEIPEQLYQDENTVIAHLKRFRDRIRAYIKNFTDPSRPQLLPDMLPPPYDRPYTLVLDLDETLIHSEWDRVHGWRTMKRPGLDLFLAHLHKYYEIVVFSPAPFDYSNPILEKLDPNGFIMYRLFRDSTRYYKGKHVKDLDCLNRDLSRVIIVDDDEKGFTLHPHNGIAIKPFKGDRSDRQLLELLPFLELIATTNVTDVREVIKSYEGQDLIATFRENQKRILEENKKRQEKIAAHQQKTGIFIK